MAGNRVLPYTAVPCAVTVLHLCCQAVQILHCRRMVVHVGTSFYNSLRMAFNAMCTLESNCSNSTKQPQIQS